MVDETANEAPEAEADPWWAALEGVKRDVAVLAGSNNMLQAQLAAIKLAPAQITNITDRSSRPWWAPDAQGMLAGGILLIAAVSLFVRMLHTSATEDKMLDTMITILFSTCLVTVYQYTFGSSRGSSQKDDTQNKLVEKLMPPTVPAPTSATSTTTTETKT